jgi:hypothetical protein
MAVALISQAIFSMFFPGYRQKKLRADACDFTCTWACPDDTQFLCIFSCVQGVAMARHALPLLVWLLSICGFCAAPPAPAFSSEAVVITINDPITPVIAEYIIREIKAAEESRAECLVLQLDTPGGLDLAMRNIIKKYSHRKCR